MQELDLRKMCKTRWVLTAEPVVAGHGGDGGVEEVEEEAERMEREHQRQQRAAEVDRVLHRVHRQPLCANRRADNIDQT